ncbi:hypothetical protein VUR80DRAFT_3511 [Thermomyces stellatus]
MSADRNSSLPSEASTLPPSNTVSREPEPESGYASSSSTPELKASEAKTATPAPQVSLSKPYLDFLNAQLETMSPSEILRFSKILFPRIHQSTAFGLTGLVTIDMLSKIQRDWPHSPPVELFFLDTLYHFKETYELVERVKERYPDLKVHVFKPYGAETTAEFEARYGEKLYETESELYDWVAKVEPLNRAYAELDVRAVFTGRRRSQGGSRQKIPVIELDDERGVVKINPLVNWSFAQVQEYIRENDVPYNPLLDKGYKSIGDWHSTSPVAEGEDERAGRWKGQDKTECGIHNKKSRYAQYLEEMAGRAREQDLANRTVMA